MLDKLDNFVVSIAGEGLLGSLGMLLVTIAIILVITILVDGIISIIESNLSKKAKIEAVKTIAGFCIKRKLANKLTLFTFFFLVLAFAFRIPKFETVIIRISMVAMVFITMGIISTGIDILNDFYMTKSISKARPIKGPLQVVKILLYIVLTIVAVSILINQNPIVLISGIGAFTAIITIVFKDALLGLAAGVQITSENLLNIGDWVRIPSADVEGSVTDISLISVKVTTFNNTVVTVPAYTFVSNSFINWHDTISDKKRQVFRTIYIDANSVKMEEDGLTNLTRYRQAIAEKISSSEHTRKEFSMQCRTGNSKDGFGLPVDIIFTTNIYDYDEYCAYCSYVSDVAYAELSNFGLKAYQIAS